MAAKSRSFPEHSYPHQRTTGAIIAAAHTVHRALGFGFLEAVYRRAVAVELRHKQFDVDTERRYDLEYREIPIGQYSADLVVMSSVIAEVKTGLILDPVAPAQTLNYLRASGLNVGLVLYFGPSLIIKRLVRMPDHLAGGTMTMV